MQGVTHERTTTHRQRLFNSGGIRGYILGISWLDLLILGRGYAYRIHIGTYEKGNGV